MLTWSSCMVVSNDQQRSFFNKIYILTNANPPKAKALRVNNKGLFALPEPPELGFCFIVCMLDTRQVNFQLKDRLKSKMKSRKQGQD